MIVQVIVVLNRTVVDSNWCFNNLFGSHLQSQSELYHVSWWYLTLVIDLIGQLSCDVIGHHTGCRNISHCQQRPYWGLRWPGWSCSPTYEMTHGFKPFTVIEKFCSIFKISLEIGDNLLSQGFLVKALSSDVLDRYMMWSLIRANSP